MLEEKNDNLLEALKFKENQCFLYCFYSDSVTFSIKNKKTLLNFNSVLLYIGVVNPVIQSNTYTISNLPKGFYFLKLSSASNFVTKKVLIN